MTHAAEAPKTRTASLTARNIRYTPSGVGSAHAKNDTARMKAKLDKLLEDMPLWRHEQSHFGKWFGIDISDASKEDSKNHDWKKQVMLAGTLSELQRQRTPFCLPAAEGTGIKTWIECPDKMSSST